MFVRLLTITSLFLGFILLNCELPQPPPGPENAYVSLEFKNSRGDITKNTLTDSIGKQIRICLIHNLTQYIDSSVLKITNSTGYNESITFKSFKGQVDTTYYPVVFSEIGTYAVIFTGYIVGAPTVLSGVITILGDTQTTPNQRPVLNLPKIDSVEVGQEFVFSVSVTDPDANQQIGIKILKKPENAIFVENQFKWTPGTADTGIVTIIFAATDNGTPVLSVTDSMILTVTATPANRSPKWNSSGMQSTIAPEKLFSLDVSPYCSDPDNDKLSFTLKSAPPARDTIIGNVYQFTPFVADTGKYSIHIVAMDSSGLTDTLTIELSVSNSGVSKADKVPPVIQFKSPSKDTVISVDSCEIRVTCIDDSGCSVKGYRDGTPFDLKKTTSTANLWTGIAKGLTQGSYSTIKIVATDSSAAKNSDSLAVRVKYDNDKTGPVITLITPLKDSVTTSNSSYTIVLKVTDLAGVLSVNGVAGATTYTGVKDTGSTWKINISTLENNKVAVIVLVATDSSLKANNTIDTIYIKSMIINGYTITFDKNDADVTGTMAPQTITSGAVVSLNVNGFSKPGYSFDGWATSPTGPITHLDGGNFLMDTSNVTLYAKWTAKIFTITFNDQQAATPVSPATMTVTAPATTISALPAEPKKTGYIFSCWNTAENGTGSVFTALTTVTSSITVYAIWNNYTYVVTFDGQSVVTNSTKEVTSPKTTVELLPVPTAAGYQFGGWYTGINGGGSPFVATTAVTGNITIYAKWTRVYRVTYNTNGGTGTVPVDPNTYQNSNNVTVLSGSGLTKQYYTFTGWNTQSDTLGTSYNGGGFFPMGSADIVLYAKWRMDVPVITTQPASATCPVNGTITFTAAATGASLSYQWQKNNTPVDGATSLSYTPPTLTVSDIGNPATYRCVVSNAGGSVNSNSAMLGVATLTDIDGNAYHQVKIGTQVWTVENLKTTRYNDGTGITKDTSTSDWGAVFTTTDSAKYCWYNNDSTTNKSTYGALYNWYAVNTGKLAPAGWHVPTDEEWTILEYYLIANGYNWDNTTSGNKIGKSLAAKTDWNSSETAGEVGNNVIINNRTGFSALPGGLRGAHGDYSSKGTIVHLWTATEQDEWVALFRYLSSTGDYLGDYFRSKTCGYSVRLIRN
ncbi:MAG TPA: InlB B-repeat-containing protein [Chitinispirillaceae bacterium]|nr:InlB B-repeat-containing protein [Chitinispirillaceae bacterium]